MCVVKIYNCGIQRGQPDTGARNINIINNGLNMLIFWFDKFIPLNSLQFPVSFPCDLHGLRAIGSQHFVPQMPTSMGCPNDSVMITLVNVVEQHRLDMQFELGFLPYSQHEYCRLECFWSWWPRIPESVGVLKCHFVPTGCHITANTCASNVSLKITNSPFCCGSHSLGTNENDSYFPIQIDLKCGDTLHLIIAELRGNL